MGLLPATISKISDTINFDSKSVGDLSEEMQLRGNQIAMIFQEPMSAKSIVEMWFSSTGNSYNTRIYLHQRLKGRHFRYSRK
jgi:ABC-type microcin C transport system duplicated ATPase subunit YejF